MFCELKYVFVVFCRRKGKTENGTRKEKIGKEEINATIQGEEWENKILLMMHLAKLTI